MFLKILDEKGRLHLLFHVLRGLFVIFTILGGGNIFYISFDRNQSVDLLDLDRDAARLPPVVIVEGLLVGLELAPALGRVFVVHGGARCTCCAGAGAGAGMGRPEGGTQVSAQTSESRTATDCRT